MKNKYLLAADAYSMSGADGYSVMPYMVVSKDQEYTLSPLKENKGAKICNLENFVGGGESMEYDLIEVPFEYDLCAVLIRKEDKKYKLTVSIDKDAEGESIELLYLEAAKNSLLKDVKAENIEFTASFDLVVAPTLEQLNNMVEENDFAKRHLNDSESIESLMRYFKEYK